MPHGFSVIEVLISLLILSLILLGFDAMQIASLRRCQQAYFFSVAEQQLVAMSERLQSFSEITKQIAIWNQQNQQLLPNGLGVISGTYPDYQLSIFWGEKMHPDDCQAGKTKCLTIEVHL